MENSSTIRCNCIARGGVGALSSRTRQKKNKTRDKGKERGESKGEVRGHSGKEERKKRRKNNPREKTRLSKGASTLVMGYTREESGRLHQRVCGTKNTSMRGGKRVRRKEGESTKKMRIRFKRH